MLILTRKLGESIIIDDDIKITVFGISNSQVKLGISAPENVSVHREEIFKRIQQENQSASLALKEDLYEVAKILKAKHIEKK